MDLQTDVLVIGLGAAGCALGYLLRQAGTDVLALELCDLAEKDKLCGGVLGAAACQLLRQIYGDDVLDELGVYWPNRLLKRSLELQLASAAGFATVERARLDRWLLARYLDAGGSVLDRVRLVSVNAAEHVACALDLRTRETYRISYGTLVGADGASSAVRRMLAGRRQRTIVSLEGEVPFAGEDVIFWYHPARVGYCWYIPTGESANAGCCLYDKDVRACREWLAELSREAGLCLEGLRGAPIPTGDDVLLSLAEDAWLTGDAAGLVSPSVSGGIHYALVSARLLASALAGGTPYEQAMAPAVEHIEREAAKIAETYLFTSLSIGLRGERHL